MASLICEITWYSGNSYTMSSAEYHHLHDCLFENFLLPDLIDIHSIYFNGYFSVIKDFEYNFATKLLQLHRLCEYFEEHKFPFELMDSFNDEI